MDTAGHRPVTAPPQVRAGRDLTAGQVYQVEHKSPAQGYPRVSVMSYLGGDHVTGEWNARPAAGTQSLPWAWVKSVKPVPQQSKRVVNADARTYGGRP